MDTFEASEMDDGGALIRFICIDLAVRMSGVIELFFLMRGLYEWCNDPEVWLAKAL